MNNNISLNHTSIVKHHSAPLASTRHAFPIVSTSNDAVSSIKSDALTVRKKTDKRYFIEELKSIHEIKKTLAAFEEQNNKITDKRHFNKKIDINFVIDLMKNKIDCYDKNVIIDRHFPFSVISLHENSKDNHPIGIAFYSKENNQIELDAIATSANVRNKGVLFIEYIINHLKCHQISLTSYLSSMKSYENLGFKRIDNNLNQYDIQMMLNTNISPLWEKKEDGKWHFIG